MSKVCPRVIKSDDDENCPPDGFMGFRKSISCHMTTLSTDDVRTVDNVTYNNFRLYRRYNEVPPVGIRREEVATGEAHWSKYIPFE